MGVLYDPTETDSNTKQTGLDLIRFNIDQMLDNGVQSTIVDEVIRDISLREIDESLEDIFVNQDIHQKIPLLTSYTVINLELFDALCEYVDVSKVSFPRNYTQNIYFIESGDFALTFIPIQLDHNSTNIYMEPLESSPDFITEIWANKKDEKSLKNTKFVNPNTLKPKKKSRI